MKFLSKRKCSKKLTLINLIYKVLKFVPIQSLFHNVLDQSTKVFTQSLFKMLRLSVRKLISFFLNWALKLIPHTTHKSDEFLSEKKSLLESLMRMVSFFIFRDDMFIQIKYSEESPSKCVKSNSSTSFLVNLIKQTNYIFNSLYFF